MIRGILGAIAGGLLGAAIWAVVSYTTGYEVGWIAWGVGALCGAGMMIGLGNSDSGLLSGVVAVIIALAAIAAGKFAAIHFHVGQELNDVRASILQMPVEDAKVYLADQLVEEYTNAGKPLQWPAESDAETATEPEEYPTDLWQDVEARWATMTPEHQEQYRQAMIDESLAATDMVHGFADAAIFVESFDFFDLIWGILAMFSAFKLGSGSAED